FLESLDREFLGDDIGDDKISLMRGLDIDIASILFSDLVIELTIGKKGRDHNICYTKYLSLIIKHLLGVAYNNENLKTMKPYHITALTFKPSTASEHGVQSKTTTEKKSKKKRSPPSSKLKASKIVRESSPSTQLAVTQHAEEPAIIADATKGLDASELVEEQRN
nr:hypothetical protein [Tanacetum cinerariifolium]